MEDIAAWSMLILTVIYGIIALVIYHKIFQVYYFNLGAGLVKELLVCGVIGGFLACLTFQYSIPVAIILVIVGIGLSAKADAAGSRISIIAMFVILAIIVLVLGSWFDSKAEEQNSYDINYGMIDTIEVADESNQMETVKI